MFGRPEEAWRKVREPAHLAGSFDTEEVQHVLGRDAHPLQALQQRQARDIVLVEVIRDRPAFRVENNAGNRNATIRLLDVRGAVDLALVDQLDFQVVAKMNKQRDSFAVHKISGREGRLQTIKRLATEEIARVGPVIEPLR